jgi:hypothetical protein
VKGQRLKGAPFFRYSDSRLTAAHRTTSFSTPGDVVISFYIGGHVFHNKLTKVAGGYQNSNGNIFANLRCVLAMTWVRPSSRNRAHRLLLHSLDRTIILLYQGKHPDMQTVLTEYVPRERAEQGGVEYANASVLRDNKPTMITVRSAMLSRLLPPTPEMLSFPVPPSCCIPLSHFPCFVELHSNLHIPMQDERKVCDALEYGRHPGRPCGG